MLFLTSWLYHLLGETKWIRVADPVGGHIHSTTTTICDHETFIGLVTRTVLEMKLMS
jgi:hypothetical protein